MGAVITFTLGGVLHPALVGAVAGLGRPRERSGAYLTGYGGRGLLSTDPLKGRLSAFFERHGSKAMFIMAALINPIYYPFAVWMGVLRVRVGRFFLFTLLGRTLKNMVLAYLGYFGIRTVLQWMGLSSLTCVRAIAYGIFVRFGGAVAQSGERLTGSQKVVGSNPISSTILLSVRSCAYRETEVRPRIVAGMDEIHEA